MTPLKAEYIGADQLPLNIFRLQRRGGPYIPIIPVYQELGRQPSATLPGLLWQHTHIVSRMGAAEHRCSLLFLPVLELY
jgi:hypothetical protein